MMIPVLPGALWLAAAAFLLLLVLVIFGFHLYQRSRLAALAGDSASAGELAAKKEQLEADVAALRATIQAQKDELRKYEAERHSQELLRVDLAQLERKLEDRKRESASSLKHAAELDLLVSRKRNLLSRLEAEIKTIEERRKSLESARQEIRNIEEQLDQGRIRLGVMAEQEMRNASLRRQADNLEEEQEALKEELGPLREEKRKLQQFIAQARQAAAVKNEQILEQTAHIRQLELAESDLQSRLRETGAEKARLGEQVAELAEELGKLEEKRMARLEEIEKACAIARADADRHFAEAAMQKSRLQDLQERLEDMEAEILRQEARRASIELMQPARLLDRKRREPKIKVAGAARNPRKTTSFKTEQVFMGQSCGIADE